MKSHLNDKPTCCLPLRPQSRHSDLWYFSAGLLSLQPCCLRLAHYITVTHSRLASNAVVSSLFDRISTCRLIAIATTCLVFIYVLNYSITHIFCTAAVSLFNVFHMFRLSTDVVAICGSVHLLAVHFQKMRHFHFCKRSDSTCRSCFP